MSVRRVEDDARFHGGPGRRARLAVDDADARAVRRLVFNLFEGRRSMAFGGVRRCAADRKFVAQHPRGPHRQREVEDDDVVARERAVVEHDRAAEVDACVKPTSPLRHRRVPVEWTPLDAPWVFRTRPDARSITSIRQNG